MSSEVPGGASGREDGGVMAAESGVERAEGVCFSFRAMVRATNFSCARIKVWWRTEEKRNERSAASWVEREVKEERSGVV